MYVYGVPSKRCVGEIKGFTNASTTERNLYLGDDNFLIAH